MEDLVKIGMGIYEPGSLEDYGQKLKELVESL